MSFYSRRLGTSLVSAMALGPVTNLAFHANPLLLRSSFQLQHKYTPQALLAARTYASGSRPSKQQKQKLSGTSKQLSPTISLYTATGDLGPLQLNKPCLASYAPESRPLSILLCWLMAKPNAIHKYAQFYLDQGFDVLTVKITPWNLLWPSTCTPIIDKELVPILDSSLHTRKIVHGFSVGGYIFGQLLKTFAQEPARHKILIDSLKAQIWDSVVDVNGVAVGVSKSVFLRPGLGQRSLENYINFHMNLFYSVATKYYDESHEYFYNHPLKAPALFLCSKVDPISTMDKIHAVQKCWKRNANIDCTLKIWDNTSHVGHMQRYPEEYKEAVRAFLGQSIGGLKSRSTDELGLDLEMEPEEAVSMLDAVRLKREQPLPRAVTSVQFKLC